MNGIPFGSDGEAAAAAWMQSLGWQCVARNIRLDSGELDWVGTDGTALLIVEVKASRHSAQMAAARIGTRKYKKLIQLASELQRLAPYSQFTEVRIVAVIGLLDTRSNCWQFEHFDCRPVEHDEA